MNSHTLEKINQLAKSLKENKLAGEMDEAVAMAKSMLLKDEEYKPVSVEIVKKMRETLEEDKKELHKAAGESEALSIDKELAEDRQEPGSKKAHEHSDNFDKTAKDVHDTAEEVHAVKDIVDDAPKLLKKEKEALTSEEFAEKKLPGTKRE